MMKNIITNIGKFILLRLIYPWQYRRFSKGSIEEGKVIFVEIRNEKISNSLKSMYERVIELGKFNIKTHFLLEGVGSRKENIKRTMAFLKDMGDAQYVFLCEANNAFACFDKRKETKVIQLWHGCGAFKKFGFSTADLKFGSSKSQQEKYPLYNNLDLVTVSSPEVVWAYKEAMGLSDDIVKPLGISRTDVFFDVEYIENCRSKIEALIPQIKGKKVILYAPTFRGDVSNAKAPDKLELEFMKKNLGDKYVILIKHHPFIKDLPEISESCYEFAFDVTHELDIDVLLCASDICISDYSSLVFEYALLNKPMIFFAYDLDDYNDWRGFYYDYDEMTPGPIVKDASKLVDQIELASNNYNYEEIKTFKNKFMEACDGQSTNRILEHVGIRWSYSEDK
ncbi:MAG: CDP-glycerol glycerophosphotransferase family protein [Bacillota bacterium]|nr:CDP-glycerol glycerophosphotransferase family protein [Bacillota bacterium]